MSHFMHRLLLSDDLKQDWAILAMPSKDLNDKGSKNRLICLAKIILNHNPSNFGVSGIGSVFSKGEDRFSLLSQIEDGSIINSVFSSKDSFALALRDIVNANLKLCITVQGDLQTIKEECKKLGIQIHTVQQAVYQMNTRGPFNRGNLDVSNDILRICTMCGHGYISFQIAERVVNNVCKEKYSPEEGAHVLAKLCRCGNFNFNRAVDMLSNLV